MNAFLVLSVLFAVASANPKAQSNVFSVPVGSGSWSQGSGLSYLSSGSAAPWSGWNSGYYGAGIPSSAAYYSASSPAYYSAGSPAYYSAGSPAYYSTLSSPSYVSGYNTAPAVTRVVAAQQPAVAVRQVAYQAPATRIVSQAAPVQATRVVASAPAINSAPRVTQWTTEITHDVLPAARQERVAIAQAAPAVATRIVATQPAVRQITVAQAAPQIGARVVAQAVPDVRYVTAAAPSARYVASPGYYSAGSWASPSYASWGSAPSYASWGSAPSYYGQALNTVAASPAQYSWSSGPQYAFSNAGYATPLTVGLDRRAKKLF